MELRQLRYFISIVDFGSFSKASSQLNIAQPALSQQIANLEAELQTELLVRSAKGTTPTHAGTRLYRKAQTILREIEQLREEARSSGDDPVVGTVSVGLPPSTSTTLTLPLIRRILDKLPGVHLRLVENLSGNLHEALVNNRIDMAVLFRAESVRGVIVEPILDEMLYFVSNDAEAAGQDFPLASLSGVRIAAPSEAHSMRSFIERICREHDVKLNIVAEVDSVPGLRNIAASGVAAVILPQSALTEPSSAGPIYKSPIIEPSLIRPLSICRSEGSPATRPIMAVAAELAAAMRDLVESQQWTGTRLY